MYLDNLLFDSEINLENILKYWSNRNSQHIFIEPRDTEFVYFKNSDRFVYGFFSDYSELGDSLSKLLENNLLGLGMFTYQDFNNQEVVDGGALFYNALDEFLGNTITGRLGHWWLKKNKNNFYNRLRDFVDLNFNFLDYNEKKYIMVGLSIFSIKVWFDFENNNIFPNINDIFRVSLCEFLFSGDIKKYKNNYDVFLKTHNFKNSYSMFLYYFSFLNKNDSFCALNDYKNLTNSLSIYSGKVKVILKSLENKNSIHLILDKKIKNLNFGKSYISLLYFKYLYNYLYYNYSFDFFINNIFGKKIIFYKNNKKYLNFFSYNKINFFNFKMINLPKSYKFFYKKNTKFFEFFYLKYEYLFDKFLILKGCGNLNFYFFKFFFDFLNNFFFNFNNVALSKLIKYYYSISEFLLNTYFYFLNFYFILSDINNKYLFYFFINYFYFDYYFYIKFKFVFLINYYFFNFNYSISNIIEKKIIIFNLFFKIVYDYFFFKKY